MNTIEFRLDPVSAAKTIAKAKKLCARANKRGLSGGWKVIGVTQSEVRDPLTGLTHFYDVLTIEGEPFQYNGWTFVASVEWIEGQPFVGSVPTYQGPEVDRDALIQGWCDHCKTKRARNKVMIVESASEGRKQVGSSCIKDFLGHDIKPTYFASPSESDFEGGIANQPYAAGTVDVLAVAVAVVETYGWVSKAMAESKTPTAHEVNNYLFDRGPGGQRIRHDVGAITPAHFEYATKVQNWVLNEWQGTGGYADNLRLAASLSRTDYRTLSTLVSAIGTYQKAQSDAAARANENITEARYAEDGQKITVDVEVTSVREFEGDYGHFAYVTFKSPTHRFKWKASARVPKQGQQITLTGTVKGTDEYQGAVFTVLTRCKFEIRETV